MGPNAIAGLYADLSLPATFYTNYRSHKEFACTTNILSISFSHHLKLPPGDSWYLSVYFHPCSKTNETYQFKFISVCLRELIGQLKDITLSFLVSRILFHLFLEAKVKVMSDYCYSYNNLLLSYNLVWNLILNIT